MEKGKKKPLPKAPPASAITYGIGGEDLKMRVGAKESAGKKERFPTEVKPIKKR